MAYDPESSLDEWSTESESELPSCPACLNFSTPPIELHHTVPVDKIFEYAEKGCESFRVIREALEPYTEKIESNSVIEIDVGAYDSPPLHLRLMRSEDLYEPSDIRLEVGDVSAKPIIASFPALSASKISGNTGSDEAVSRARAWLDECLNEHHDCYFASSSLLPTRVLRIDGRNNVRLYVPNHEIASYACLSHCWGKKPFIQTTTLNLQIHQAGIPWNVLPKTFQDAISFVYRLGLKYLWIDSLCIVQDSVEDWRREGSNMSRIYEDSYVTLAATISTEASAGCFVTSDPKHISRTIRTQNLSGEPCDVHCRVPLNHLMTCQPLDGRGWVFQERMLYTRIISFLEHEITWECPQRFDCECSQICTWSTSHSKHKMNLHVLFGGLEGVPYLLDRWEEIVTQYTSKSLTFPSDIFPALQGLAKKFQPSMGDYVAGHWRATLAHSLHWAVSYDSPGRARPSVWRAPTWSWASVQSQVVWLGPSSFRGTWNCEMKATATILSAKTVPSGTGPTGQLSSGSLTIKGRFMRGKVTYNEPKHEIPPYHVRVSYASLTFGDGNEELDTKDLKNGDVWWDYTLENEGPDHIANDSAVLVLELDEREDGLSRNWLVLTRAVDDGENVYKRVGLFQSNHSYGSPLLLQERSDYSPYQSTFYSPPFSRPYSPFCSPSWSPTATSDHDPPEIELKMQALYEAATEEIAVTIV